MTTVDGHKVWSIWICDRVRLWCGNAGFRFSHALHKPEKLDDWSQWDNFWPLYKKDGIEKKMALFLSGLSDHQKGGAMYQHITFKD